MDTSNNVYVMRKWAVTALLVILSVSTVFILHSIGISSRHVGSASPLSRGGYQIFIANDSAELYSLWKDRGMYGRIVVNVGNYLHFVAIDRGDIYQQRSEYPVSRLSLADEYEKMVSNRNVLRVAMQSGIARAIFHVVSPEVFKEKYALVENGLREGSLNNIWLSDDRIITNERGSERIITTVMPYTREPVLLVIDASFFSYGDEDLLSRILNESDLETDLLIFNLEAGNTNVAMDARRRLKEFTRGFAL
jgi:hypothetical protein